MNISIVTESFVRQLLKSPGMPLSDKFVFYFRKVEAVLRHIHVFLGSEEEWPFLIYMAYAFIFLLLGLLFHLLSFFSLVSSFF